MTDQPIIHLLCGLPGSGKSVRAGELEAAGAGIVLNADSWVWKLYPDDAEAAARDERKVLVHELQWELTERLLLAGVDVIFEWGVWSRDEREDIRSKASELGAIVRLEYLDAPLATLHERIAARNADLPAGSFRISAAELDEWAGLFEAPTAEELSRG